MDALTLMANAVSMLNSESFTRAELVDWAYAYAKSRNLNVTREDAEEATDRGSKPDPWMTAPLTGEERASFEKASVESGEVWV